MNLDDIIEGTIKDFESGTKSLKECLQVLAFTVKLRSVSLFKQLCKYFTLSSLVTTDNILYFFDGKSNYLLEGGSLKM